MAVAGRSEPGPVPLSIRWNWKERYQEFMAEQGDEAAAQLAVRQDLVDAHKFVMAYVTDLYYLFVKGFFYRPRLLQIVESELPAGTAPIIEDLRKISEEHQAAHEAELREQARQAAEAEAAERRRQEEEEAQRRQQEQEERERREREEEERRKREADLRTKAIKESIDGWPAERVQALQRLTAEDLGKPVAFRDALASGGEGPELVVIPAGSFRMGSPADEAERNDDEGPQYRVTIIKPFAIGKYAVTFEDYKRYCVDTSIDLPYDEGWGRGRWPIIHVSWHDARAYCTWLNVQTGKRYRLPSEAEWEYACRAGSVTPFWWGSTIDPKQANYDGNHAYNGGARGEYRERTVPVEQFEPNPFGLYQMHGNVWEWCEDAWHDDYQGAPVDGSAWFEGHVGKGEFVCYRVVRGGSWGNNPERLRSAGRGWSDPAGRIGNLGFRLAQDL